MFHSKMRLKKNNGMKIIYTRGYYRLLEYYQIKSLHCKSCYAITFTFNHAPCNLLMEVVEVTLTTA